MKILLLFFIAQACLAHEIAFMKIYRPDGDVMQLESDFDYAHVAIKVDEGWLHTHPLRGTEVVKDLRHIGYREFDVLVKKTDLKMGDYKYYLGRPYDHDYLWDDDYLYCSELIAKLLGIPPVTMDFDINIWGQHPAQGLPGISPGVLYHSL